MNAAGGSSSGTDPGAGGGNTFNPGGRPGGPGGGGFNPGGGSSATTGNYNIYIYGGDLYVNCDGDGLDSNGGLYLYGGTQAVFSMRSGGDNSAIDADGTVSIQGASVFTAGTTGMDGSAQSGWFGSNQKYYASKTSYSAGKIINTKAGSSGSVVFSYALPKAVNYIMASYPSTVSANTPSFATATSVTACKGGSWSHTWNSGSVSNGVITYTCTKCGATEKRDGFCCSLRPFGGSGSRCGRRLHDLLCRRQRRKPCRIKKPIRFPCRRGGCGADDCLSWCSKGDLHQRYTDRWQSC